MQTYVKLFHVLKLSIVPLRIMEYKHNTMHLNLRTRPNGQVHGPPALSPNKEPPATGATDSIVKQKTIKTRDVTPSWVQSSFLPDVHTHHEASHPTTLKNGQVKLAPREVVQLYSFFNL
jgi:hypothetical protein